MTLAAAGPKHRGTLDPFSPERLDSAGESGQTLRRMRNLLFSLAVGLGLAPAVAFGAPRSGAPVRGPLVQLVTRDSAVIRWFTDDAVPGAVCYGTDPRRLTGTAVDPAARRDHEVRLTGLRGSATYYYRVRAGAAVAAGADQYFKTAPATTEPFRFVVFGDTRGPVDSCRSAPGWNSVAHLMDRLHPAFVVGTGDYVAHGERPECWRSWIDASGGLFRHTPFFPAIGNHDYDHQIYTGEQNAGLVNFTRWFALPPGPQPGVLTSYYAFTYGHSRFIVYDDYQARGPGSPQPSWLERELKAARSAPEIQHVFVVNHTTFEGVGSFCRADSPDHNQATNRATVEPLLERYEVDASFAGHEHDYSRVVRHGIQHVVTGGGGAPLEAGEGSCHLPRCGGRPGLVTYNGCTHHAVLVEVDGANVRYTALATDGVTRLDHCESQHWAAKGSPAKLATGGGGGRQGGRPRRARALRPFPKP
jgi:hypothetical protein